MLGVNLTATAGAPLAPLAPLAQAASLAVLLIGLGYLLLCGLYLNLLVLAARRYRARPRSAHPTWDITVLIPAHNEAAGIEQTVRELGRQDYPPHLWRIIVIADNCQDDTARRAALAGAQVLVRDDPAHPGKGAALRWAIDRSGVPGAGRRAVAVLDADSTASPAWLRRADAYLESGAQAVQAFYGILNVDASWRARLMGVALLLFHHVRGAGREVLGWSAGLKGNGMVFSAGLVAAQGWSADSITEDLEYACRLALNGIRVAYDGGSTILGPAGVRGGASTQRLRWEGGRLGLLGRRAGPLLVRALQTRSLMRFDAAMELVVLPLTMLVVLATALLGLSLAALWVGLGSGIVVAGTGLAGALLAVYVVAGLWAVHAPRRVYATLALAPPYLAWKVALYGLMAVAGRPKAWVRTERR